MALRTDRRRSADGEELASCREVGDKTANRPDSRPARHRGAQRPATWQLYSDVPCTLRREPFTDRPHGPPAQCPGQDFFNLTAGWPKGKSGGIMSVRGATVAHCGEILAAIQAVGVWHCFPYWPRSNAAPRARASAALPVAAFLLDLVRIFSPPPGADAGICFQFPTKATAGGFRPPA